MFDLLLQSKTRSNNYFPSIYSNKKLLMKRMFILLFKWFFMQLTLKLLLCDFVIHLNQKNVNNKWILLNKQIKNKNNQIKRKKEKKKMGKMWKKWEEKILRHYLRHLSILDYQKHFRQNFPTYTIIIKLYGKMIRFFNTGKNVFFF